MTPEEMQKIGDAYEAKFGGISDEICYPQIMGDKRFFQLLVDAVKSGKPVTQDDMKKVFGDLSWEEVVDDTAPPSK